MELRCIICDEVVEQEEFQKRLDAHRSFLEWRENLGLGGHMPLVICRKCKADPDRAERLMRGQDMEAKLDAAVKEYAERPRRAEGEEHDRR